MRWWCHFWDSRLCRDTKLISKDKEGKYIIIDFFKNNTYSRLINIHAPNIEIQRKQFFKNIRKWITHHCIIIGDFNVTLTKTDISNNCVFSEDSSRNALFDLISNNGLIDLWRLFNTTKKQFTRKQTHRLHLQELPIL
uniref:Endonuclease/exonuclease/phosphatase domain-containing protein n=1 Tax=Fundulus heteroclitus TaxID=8078 RepID=A0A3Q2PW83_FUNHE